MEKEYKVINAHIFNPKNALFKTHENRRLTCQTVLCCNTGNCNLYKVGQCAMRNVLGWGSCPYGKGTHENGPTTRANSFSSWKKEREEKYEGLIDILTWPVDKMAYIGEYVFLPYAHMNMNEKVKFLSHSRLFCNGSYFVKKDDFNLETICCILNFHPYALMGGEIMDYQRKSVPAFLKHLREVDNELFTRFFNQYPDYIQPRIESIQNNIGRTALLKTVNPCSFKNDKATFIWDGKIIKTNDDIFIFSPLGNSSNRGYDKLDITFHPTDKCEIKITDNNQVNDKTIFID